jgi:hypothetical protein
MVTTLLNRLITTEYAAGKDRSGKSVGFKSSRANLPLNPSILRTVSSPEQKALDYQYSSVDDDEDGIPDKAPSTGYAHHPKIEIIQESKNVVPQQASQSTVTKIYPVSQTASNSKIDHYAQRLLQIRKLKITEKPIVNASKEVDTVVKPYTLTSYGTRIKL